MPWLEVPEFGPDRSLLLGLLVFPLVALGLLLMEDGRGVRVAGLLLVVAGHAYFLWRLGRQDLSRRPVAEARLWRFLAVASVMWGGARLFQAGYMLAWGSMPSVPSIADLALLAGLLAAVGAVIRDPFPRNPRKGEVRDLLETAVIGIGTMVIFWLTVVSPAIEVGIDSTVTVAWMSIGPAIDLVLLILFLRLIFLSSRRSERLVLELLAMAFVVRIPADLAVGYGVLWGALAVRPAADLGWVLSPLAMTVAAHLQVGRDESEVGQVPRTSSLSHRLGTWLPVVVTYVVAGFTIVNWWLVGTINWFAAVTASGLGLLLVARQGVIAGQAEMRQYATLVEGAGDLAFVCGSSGELLLSNPALERAVGLTNLGEENHRLGDFLEDSLGLEAMLARASEEGWSGEVEFKAADGTRLPVALSLRPVVDERRAEPVLAGTAHDLTQLKRRERDLRRALHEVAEAREELQQLNLSLEAKVEARTQELEQSVRRLEKVNEELKELDRLKSEFVTLVSHELRAPLTNIRSGVELLLKDPDELPDSVEETLELVSNETERLVDFVEIILDLSALEAGRFPLEFEPLEMATLVGMVAARFPATSGGDRIEVEMDGELPLVRGDERAVNSVLFHLLDNAIKYAPQGPVRVRGQVHGNNVRIAVCDDGPGIPAAAREAVFDRFHRLDTSDSRQVYGRGLGLYLSRRLVEAMGGQIEAAQSASGGAEVTFELPLYE